MLVVVIKLRLLPLYIAGGLLGLFNNCGAYQKWCRTTSARVQLYERTLEMCGMIHDPEMPKAGKHRELEPAQIKKSEEAVQSHHCHQGLHKPLENPWQKPTVLSSIWGSNRSRGWRLTCCGLRLQGGLPRSSSSKSSFVSKRKEFLDRLKKLKLKTIDHCSKRVKLTSAQGKVDIDLTYTNCTFHYAKYILLRYVVFMPSSFLHFPLQLFVYQEQSNLAYQLLIKSQIMEMPINLEELMRYPLSPVPHALGSPDGYFAKTNKATILHHLLKDRDEEVPYPKDALYIQDGNALFHMMFNLPPTCGEICMQLLDLMVAKHHFVFSTDCYQPDSIKAQERLRRGFTEKYIIDGPNTRKPYDFKSFLCNELNKQQLCDLLLKVWGSNEAASRIEKSVKAVVCVNGKSYDLTSTNGKVSWQKS